MRERSYRRDIDGLRAVAVLAVILFHIEKSLLPGGFVGVDIFFVLSGFLITGKIAQDLDAGRFSLRDFYCRRIKRIAPAMLVVVLVTVLAAQVLLLPEDAVAAGKAGLWSLGSLTNVYYTFFRDTGYFAQSSAELPLLHLWSLGVEEQFYLIWPLVLMFLYRPLGTRALLLLVGTTALASYVLGQFLFAYKPSFAYYMLPSRAGELLAGAIVALAIERRVHLRLPARLAQPFGYLGAVCLLAAFCWLEETQVFPGLRAMLPAAGTALLLLSGHMDQAGVPHLLRWRPLRAVGQVSYSAYLWHWPLLAFYRYGYGQPGLASGTAIFLLTLLLAWLTYALIEQPFRTVPAGRWRAIFGGYGVATMAVGVLALAVVYPQALINRVLDTGYHDRLAKVRANDHAPTDFDYVCMRKVLVEKDGADPRCILNREAAAGQPPSVLLWGDSNAAHYVGMVDEFARRGGYSVRNLSAGTCAPVLGPVDGFVDQARAPYCLASQQVIAEVLKSTGVVIIAAAWTVYQDRSTVFIERFFATVERLTKQGKQVVLIGRIPLFNDFDRLCAAKALTYPWRRCDPLHLPMDEHVAAMNEKLQQFAHTHSGVTYFDATSYLCPNGVCSTHSAGGEQLYYDYGHLSVPGGRLLGQAILEKQGLPPPFRIDPPLQSARDASTPSITPF